LGPKGVLDTLKKRKIFRTCRKSNHKSSAVQSMPCNCTECTVSALFWTDKHEN